MTTNSALTAITFAAPGLNVDDVCCNAIYGDGATLHSLVAIGKFRIGSWRRLLRRQRTARFIFDELPVVKLYNSIEFRPVEDTALAR